MSWSVTIIGDPIAIAQKLDDFASTLSGQSLEEYNEAKPHLQALVSLNVNNTADKNGYGQMIHLEANGHGYFEGGEKRYGTCGAKITPIYGLLALTPPAASDPPSN